jgi:glycosyltransferase involved in cell wall biosynthesis
MESPYFSVVVPTYNRKETLTRCLDALVRQTATPSMFEVIVVDDGSTDGTSEMLRTREFPFAFRSIAVPNGGASAARNAGVSVARGEYIALTEDDVVPEDRWLASAQRHLSAGAIDMLEGRTVALETGRDIRRFDTGGVPSFIPCNLFIRRSVFEKVGGYDPAFYDGQHHLYFREDADFGFRGLDAGHRFAFGPDVVVSHPLQFHTVGECFRHARRYRFDPLLYKKHPVRFREMIEVKRALGVTIHRPLHLVALVYLISLLVAAATFATGWVIAGWGAVAVAFFCGMVYRYRYQGRRAVRLDKLIETAGFFVLPIVYLWSVIRGCIRYRTAGPLL